MFFEVLFSTTHRGPLATEALKTHGTTSHKRLTRPVATQHMYDYNFGKNALFFLT